ncbi:MAG: TrbC/VirB2 family protein [Erythrobacter sp.]|nr:TrbC/VirB2 family protein [Erythrobacter sp.]
MAISPQAPLLAGPEASPIASSLEWINGVLFGQIAVGLCVLAVAFVGMQMLTGRWRLRLGFRAVLGCFVLLGAPIIAAGLMGGLEDRPTTLVIAAPDVPEVSPREELEPAEYDPYAGASLRVD